MGEIYYVFHAAVSLAATLLLMATFTLLRKALGRTPDPSRVALASAILSWPLCASKEVSDLLTGWGNPELGDLLANTVGIALAAAPVIVAASFGYGED